MHETFQFSVHRLPDRTNLRQRQFTLQDEPAVTQTLGKTRFLRRTDGALSGRVKNHPFRSQPRYGGVLNDQGVHTGLLQLLQQPAGLRNLLLVNQRIESHINAHAEPMRILAQPADVLHGIAGRLPRPEGGAGDINGIGTAVNGRDADIRRPGGGEEFEISPLRPRLRSK